MTLYELLRKWAPPERSMVAKMTRNIMVYSVDAQGKEEYLLSFSYQEWETLTTYLSTDLLDMKVERFSFVKGSPWTMEVALHV